MSSMPRYALKTSASKPGVIVVPSSALKAFARAMTSCGSEMSAGVILFDHLGGRVAEHALGPDVEDLNDALLVGGDAREVGAVENGVLQGACLEQRLFCLFARGIIGADQQIADDCTLIVSQRRYRNDSRKTAAVLADIRQLVDVLDPRAALKTSASKPGVIGVASSRLSAAARVITSCGSEMSAGVILFITSAAA